MDKIYFTYVKEDGADNTTEISIGLDGDIDLTSLFARFVDFTRMMGYYSGSWENVFKEFAEGREAGVDAFECANSIMYDC